MLMLQEVSTGPLNHNRAEVKKALLELAELRLKFQTVKLTGASREQGNIGVMFGVFGLSLRVRVSRA